MNPKTIIAILLLSALLLIAGCGAKTEDTTTPIPQGGGCGLAQPEPQQEDIVKTIYIPLNENF